VSRVRLQALLAALGAVATVAGARGVLKGSSEVIEGGPVSANVDNEYRFYAAWYHVMGLLVLRAARQPESETAIVRICAGGLLVGACGRILSIRTLGQPHALQKVLMGLEFAIPVVIVPWQMRVAREVRKASQIAEPLR
jgi:hypothetical protein